MNPQKLLKKASGKYRLLWTACCITFAFRGECGNPVSRWNSQGYLKRIVTLVNSPKKSSRCRDSSGLERFNHAPTMDYLDSIIPMLDNVPWFQVLIVIVSSTAIYGFFYFASLEDETPVSFRIPVPEQCSSGWKGELLDEPSIKVDTIGAWFSIAH